MCGDDTVHFLNRRGSAALQHPSSVPCSFVRSFSFLSYSSDMCRTRCISRPSLLALQCGKARLEVIVALLLCAFPSIWSSCRRWRWCKGRGRCRGCIGAGPGVSCLYIPWCGRAKALRLSLLRRLARRVLRCNGARGCGDVHVALRRSTCLTRKWDSRQWTISSCMWLDLRLGRLERGGGKVWKACSIDQHGLSAGKHEDHTHHALDNKIFVGLCRVEGDVVCLAD